MNELNAIQKIAGSEKLNASARQRLLADYESARASGFSLGVTKG